MDELTTELEALHSDAFVWAVACCDGDRAEAEDVLQTAYLKVLDGRAKFGGKSTFKTWLFGVIRYTARATRRRRKVRDFLLFKWGGPDTEPRESPREAAEANQTRTRLLSALRGLSNRQREVLDLVFYHDMTVEEASDVMGVSLGTARTHYHRGKKALAERLAEMKEERYVRSR